MSASVHEWKVGDRVQWEDGENPYRGKPGLLSGVIRQLDQRVSARVELDDKTTVRGDSWWVPSSILRPAPPVIAPKEQGGSVPTETETADAATQCAAEPERPTADDLAWKLRAETLAAEEAKRRHYEERRRAYAEQNGDDHGGTHRVRPEAYAAESAKCLDRAIAALARPAADGPAYDYPHWPEADPSDP